MASLDKVQIALKLLSDKDFIVSNLPHLTGVEGDRVRLTFRRLFFNVTDKYRIHIEQGESEVRIELVGEKSLIRMTFTPTMGGLASKAAYRGPKGFLIRKLVTEAARRLARAALEEAERRAEGLRREANAGGSGDYSRKLASLSWTTRLLQKGMLVDQRLLSLPPGGLVAQIEDILAHGGLLEQYGLVYVSGTSDNGTFKMLFSRQGVLGVYVNVSGQEYYGDERALAMIHGLVSLRIYGILARPEEVLAA